MSPHYEPESERDDVDERWGSAQATVILDLALLGRATTLSPAELFEAIRDDLKHVSPVNVPDAWAEVIGVKLLGLTIKQSEWHRPVPVHCEEGERESR